MTIDLHIERLVLEGVDVAFADRAHVAAAVESELVRMLGEGGLHPALAGGVALPSISAPDATIAPRAGAAQIGGAIAQSLHGGIGGKR